MSYVCFIGCTNDHGAIAAAFIECQVFYISLYYTSRLGLEIHAAKTIGNDNKPDGIVKLLWSVGSPNDDNALTAARNTVKLDQELCLKAAAGIMLASRTL